MWFVNFLSLSDTDRVQDQIGMESSQPISENKFQIEHRLEKWLWRQGSDSDCSSASFIFTITWKCTVRSDHISKLLCKNGLVSKLLNLPWSSCILSIFQTFTKNVPLSQLAEFLPEQCHIPLSEILPNQSVTLPISTFLGSSNPSHNPFLVQYKYRSLAPIQTLDF